MIAQRMCPLALSSYLVGVEHGGHGFHEVREKTPHPFDLRVVVMGLSIARMFG